MSGWAETPGGGRLARMIADAFARAAESDDLDDPDQAGSTGTGNQEDGGQ